MKNKNNQQRKKEGVRIQQQPVTDGFQQITDGNDPDNISVSGKDRRFTPDREAKAAFLNRIIM